MCFICALEAAAKAALGIETREESVGTISAPLLAEFVQFIKDKDLAKLEVEEIGLKARRQYLAGEITEDDVAAAQGELNAKAEQLTERFDARHDTLWAKAYAELNLNADDVHHLNRKTGEITRDIEVPIDELTARRRRAPQGGGLH